MAYTSSIEQFVDGYITRFKRSNNFRSKRMFIIKAIKMIEWYLNRPCCEDPEATIEFARRDDELTDFIKRTLDNGFDRRKNRKSLLKVEKKLRGVLYNPCCFTDVIVDPSAFTCIVTGESVITFFGQEGQGTFSLTIQNGDISIKTLGLPTIGNFIMKFVNTGSTGDIVGVTGYDALDNVVIPTISTGGSSISSLSIPVEGLSKIVIECL